MLRNRIKIYDYIIVLKRPGYYYMVDWVSKLMMFLALVTFFYNMYWQNRTGQSSRMLQMIPIVTVVCSWWLFQYMQSRRGLTPFYRFALLAAAFGWYQLKDAQWLCLAYCIAAALEKAIKTIPEVALDMDEIAFNTLNRKKYRWNEVSNVVLKDGLLTIDLNNNRLFQRETDAETTPAEEKEFNEFCRKALLNGRTPGTDA